MERIRSRPQLSNTTVSVVLRSLVLGIALAAPARGQECPPPGSACPRGGTPVHVDFEGLAPGTPVEGLGTVHPDLAISSVTGVASPACMPGTARGIEELDMTFPSYGSTAGSNDCLNGIRGFGDDPGCTLDYEFTFSAGTTVGCFSIRMLDYGDLFPNGGTTHTVLLQAYAGMTLVDTASLVMMGGVNLVTGDACSSQAGDPGNTLLRVVANGITRVTLTFDEVGDPNVGFDDIQFCKDLGAVAVEPVAWGRLKALYTVP